MADMTHPYDQDFPFVVKGNGIVVAKCPDSHTAEMVAGHLHRSEVIDTTPEPRVPDDALWIAYSGYGTSNVETWELTVAARQGDLWFPPGEEQAVPLEELPDVTPETVFIVLAKKED